MNQRSVTAALMLLGALLVAALIYIWLLSSHLAAISPGRSEQALVDRAAIHLAAEANVSPAEWRKHTYPIVMTFGRGEECVDFRPRRRHVPSGLVCFRNNAVAREIVRGPE